MLVNEELIHKLIQRIETLEALLCIDRPTREDVRRYADERRIASMTEADRFFDYWEQFGWCRGKKKDQPIRDWKAAWRTWESKVKADVQQCTAPSLIELDPIELERRRRNM